jgi:hypothetical protein
MHSLLASLEPSSRLDCRTALVLDEAGMAPTRQSAQLLAYAELAGAKVIAIGDPGQLGSVEAGGWLAALTPERSMAAYRAPPVRGRRARGRSSASVQPSDAPCPVCIRLIQKAAAGACMTPTRSTQLPMRGLPRHLRGAAPFMPLAGARRLAHQDDQRKATGDRINRPQLSSAPVNLDRGNETQC